MAEQEDDVEGGKGKKLKSDSSMPLTSDEMRNTGREWSFTQHFWSHCSLHIGGGLAQGDASGSSEGSPGRVCSIMGQKMPEDTPTCSSVQLVIAKECRLHVWVIRGLLAKTDTKGQDAIVAILVMMDSYD